MTDDSYDNDRLDERLRKLAAEHYNAPRGAVPRDAMWSAIAAARRAERADADRPTVIPIGTRRRTAQWLWVAAVAAALLAGVVIDRAIVGSSRGTVMTASTPATPVPASPTPPDSATPAPRQLATATLTTTFSEPRSGTTHAPRDDDRIPKSTTRVAQAPTSSAEAHTSTPAPSSDAVTADPRGLYQAAARQTLVQAEALLTSYRRADAEPRDAEAMRQAARWSRDVLTSTRLLLDSPAGRDPRLRQLLTDLELVLAQIVQVSGAPLQADEREMIERALRERDLLPRLRSAVPAGVAAS